MCLLKMNEQNTLSVANYSITPNCHFEILLDVQYWSSKVDIALLRKISLSLIWHAPIPPAILNSTWSKINRGASSSNARASNPPPVHAHPTSSGFAYEEANLQGGAVVYGLLNEVEKYGLAWVYYKLSNISTALLISSTEDKCTRITFLPASINAS